GENALAYERPRIETKVEELEGMGDNLARLIKNYAALIGMGGEVVSALAEISTDDQHPWHPIAPELLAKAVATTQPLANQLEQRVCQRCMHRFTAHKLDSGETYYGCRHCHQSLDMYDAVEVVVATLDSRMTEKAAQHGDEVLVNWLAHRQLFDFDTVELIRTTDEDVERFAVQIGNDTDPNRRARYKQMRYAITSKAMLSENSLRILKQVFGKEPELLKTLRK
ncbi:MAG: hypothetical protein AAF485_22690, partial [Chloroflexota bacterium]